MALDSVNYSASCFLYWTSSFHLDLYIILLKCCIVFNNLFNHSSIIRCFISFTITNNVLVSLLIHLSSYILQNVSESIFLRNRIAGSKMYIFMPILILIEKLPDYFSPQKKKKANKKQCQFPFQSTVYKRKFGNFVIPTSQTSAWGYFSAS